MPKRHVSVPPQSTQQDVAGNAASKTRFLTALVVLGSYTAACLLPAADGYRGVAALLMGWMVGLPGSNFGAGFPAVVPWSANLLLFIGWVMLLRHRFAAAGWLGVTALVLAPLSWATAVAPLKVGYYVWHASMIALAVGALRCHRESAKRSRTKSSTRNHLMLASGDVGSLESKV